MKKMICYFLVCTAILALIAGCVYNGTNEQSNPTLVATAPEVSGSHTEPSTQPQFTVPEYSVPPMPTVPGPWPEQSAGTITEDGIAILTGNNNSVYYLGSAGIVYYSFYILSQQQLDPKSITVSVPIEHRYFVSVNQIPLGGAAEITKDGVQPSCAQNDFPYALYLAYQGKDFEKLAQMEWKVNQLYSFAQQCHKMLENKEITMAEYEQLVQPHRDALAELCAYRTEELGAYCALTQEDIPQFYVYSVTVSFDYTTKATGETFTYIDVTIGTRVYRQQVGQITLKDRMQLPAQLDWYTNVENADDGIMGSGNCPEPYNGGVHQINTYFHFKADVFKSLKRIVLDNPAHQIDRVWMKVKSENGQIFEDEWDMTEPYDIYPGDDVIIYVSYRDEYKENLGYTTKVYGYLEYESDGATYCKMSECYIGNKLNFYVQYALIFEGMDLSSYYWDYYYPLYEPWRLDGED